MQFDLGKIVSGALPGIHSVWCVEVKGANVV
jgi:hypothetical protein